MSTLNLLKPLQLGDLKLPNRVWLAPLTRSRAVGEGRIPNALMAEYYKQRATAGLILTEATVVSPQGIGYANTPGIWSKEQVVGWTAVTQAVHKAGGRIFLQLWHVGRHSHPMFQKNGELPVAPSAVAPEGHVSLVRPKTAFVAPRPLELKEIPGIVNDFRRGAENAQKAGFDGVEIHGANGYLLDQFLQDKTNLRTDGYGGSIENRARFMLEVTDAVVSVWGASRVGMHLAPRGDAHSMGDSNPKAVFSYVARELGRRKLAFLCAREHNGEGRLGPELKKIFGGVYVMNERFTCETGEAELKAGHADAIAFGQIFLANPDLPKRFELNAPFNKPVPETFYSGGAEGYTDYPFLGG